MNVRLTVSSAREHLARLLDALVGRHLSLALWVVVVALALAASQGVRNGLLQRAEGLHLRAVALNDEQGSAEGVAATPAGDFTAALGPRRPASAMIARLEQAAALANVGLVGVSTSEHEANPKQLGRLELSVQLRGSYGATKQALSELLAREPVLTVSAMRMRHDTSTGILESSMVLALWASPAKGAADAATPWR